MASKQRWVQSVLKSRCFSGSRLVSEMDHLIIKKYLLSTWDFEEVKKSVMFCVRLSKREKPVE